MKKFYYPKRRHIPVIIPAAISKAMRITAFLLFVCALNVHAKSFSQDRLTLNLKDVRLSQVFSIIQQKTDYQFLYNTEDVRKAPLVSISVKKATVPEILADCFEDFPLTYRIENKTVVVVRKIPTSPVSLPQIGKLSTFENAGTLANSLSGRLSSPEKIQRIEFVVKGKVTDETGNPLAGVSVTLKGSTVRGTTTNENGNYSISLESGVGVLVISFVGYISQEISVDRRNVIDIVLFKDSKELGEVIVTALGIKRSKGSLTYATQSVDPTNLVEARTDNVISGLSGKVAGINITSASTGVGSETKVVLRGHRSINGSSQPLYVVDGLVLNGDISNISPDEIESISVLKGANAAALYGSRANNGAIVITTKSGAGLARGVTPSVGFNYTQNTPIKLMKFQNEYGQGTDGIYSPSAINSWGPKMEGQQVQHWSNDPEYIANQLNGNDTYALLPQPDNIWDFFRRGSSFNTNLSVNVKGENSNVFINYTNTHSGGIIRGNDLIGHNLGMRANVNLTNRLQFETNVNYIRQDFSNILATSFNFRNPVYFLYQTGRNIRTADLQHYQFVNEAGRTLQHFYSPGFNGAGNPYWTIYNELSPRMLERVLAMASLKYNITDHLSILGRSGIDRNNVTDETKLHNDTYTTAPNGSYAKSAGTSYEWNTDVLINYNQEFLTNFRIDLNAGANNRVYKANSLSSSGSNFLIPNLFSLGNTSNPVTSDSYAQKNVNSVYGFAEISYHNAIYLNATARNDWSSTLPPQNRSYFYPSIGLSAILSNLIDFPQVINYLKLRASYASVGNDTDPYMLARSAQVENGAITFSTVLPNANLKPERTHSFEGGVDFGLLSDRIRASFTYYKQNAFDQLFATLVPPASGVSSLFQNGGNIQNNGIEIYLGLTPIRHQDFSWDIDINLAKNNSKVLELTEGLNELAIGGADYMRMYKLVTGEPFGTVFTRGFVKDAQGRVIVSNTTGLPLTTADMGTKSANFNPDWLGGITNTFRYKNFSLNFLIDIRKGGSFVSFTESIYSGAGVLDYTAQGRDGSLIFGKNVFTEFEAVTEDGHENTQSVSAQALWTKLGGLGAPVGEAFIRSASNARLRELVLGYTFPDKFFSERSIFFKSARISFVGRNLFFLYNKAKNIDPEIVTDVSNAAEGRESLNLPTTRSFGVSVNFTF